MSTTRLNNCGLLAALAPEDPTTASECMYRARACNVLAKKVTGTFRRHLYRLKDANIHRAMQLGPAALRVTGDSQYRHGLLRVRLASAPQVCVHTHENWLSVA